jgi:uncharacterized protein
MAMIAFPLAVFMVADRVGLLERIMIESPCTKVCTLDARRGHCLGCGRTVEEIARWTAMSAAERARVMAELPGRLAAQAGAVASAAAG